MAKFPLEYLEYLPEKSPQAVEVSALVCKVQNAKPYGMGLVLEMIPAEELQYRMHAGDVVMKNKRLSLLQTNKLKSYINEGIKMVKVQWFKRHRNWNKCRFKESTQCGWYPEHSLMVISKAEENE